MESFFDLASRLTSLTQSGKNALEKILKRYEFGKGHTLVNENSICRQAYFIETGLARTYYYKDGKDVTDWFSTEGRFACSIVSFLSQRPDKRAVELLEPSVLWSLDHNDLEHLCAEYHDVEHLIRLLVNHGLMELQQRFDDLHFSTATQRYQKLMQSSPTLIHRASLSMIASYLGVTQETLSRIRTSQFNV